VRGSSGGKRLALGVAWPLGGVLDSCSSSRHRGQIGGGRLFEQLRLLGRQMLGLDAEAPAFV
jgi:hypothetical protein